MATGDYKVNFKDLKSRVGVDDIAYVLGYRLDRKAGVGKYIELVLGQGRDRRDTLIVSNPRDKTNQTWFRRDGSKGDVVTLIRENLNSFNVSGKDDWQKVAKVLARYANMPEPEYSSDREYVRSASTSSVFDPSRYETKDIQPGANRDKSLFHQRGLYNDTVDDFLPYISLIRDTRNDKFEGYNVGFPYRTGDSDEVVGYEIRGFGGYKSKAAGTNSNSACWMAAFQKTGRDKVMPVKSSEESDVKSVFFFESAFDAMAFYQLNRLRMGERFAVVSLGGTFSDGQIESVRTRFPQARPFECFDNDIAGRTYALRLVSIYSGVPIKITKTEEGLTAESNGKSMEINLSRIPFAAQVDKPFGIPHIVGSWTPYHVYKDWNDCLLEKRMEPEFRLTKFDRNQNLENERKSNLKL